MDGKNDNTTSSLVPVVHSFYHSYDMTSAPVTEGLVYSNFVYGYKYELYRTP